MNNIHRTAIVSKNASIGNDIIVAPYAIIEDDTVIGNNVEIGPHAVLYNGARIGNKVKIKQAASVAHVPQDLKLYSIYNWRQYCYSRICYVTPWHKRNRQIAGG